MNLKRKQKELEIFLCNILQQEGRDDLFSEVYNVQEYNGAILINYYIKRFEKDGDTTTLADIGVRRIINKKTGDLEYPISISSSNLPMRILAITSDHLYYHLDLIALIAQQFEDDEVQELPSGVYKLDQLTGEEKNVKNEETSTS